MNRIVTSSVLNLWLAKCISTKTVKVTGKRVELRRQCTENVVAMNEKETYATPGVILAFAIVLTCLWFIIALCALLDANIQDWAEYLVIHLAFLAGSWFEVAEKKEILNKRLVRYIQAMLMVIIILLIASYYHLL